MKELRGNLVLVFTSQSAAQNEKRVRTGRDLNRAVPQKTSPSPRWKYDARPAYFTLPCAQVFLSQMPAIGGIA
jgi:hypothetical protein